MVLSRHIHPTAIINDSAEIQNNVFIGENVSIGAKTVIQHGAYIEKNCVIGKNSRIGTNAVLRRETIIGDNTVFGSLSASEGKNWIGNNVLIHSQCHITTGLVIEDCVFIAPMFVGANDPDMLHQRGYIKKFFPQAPYIKFGSRIGVGVTMNPGVIIGRESVIGSSSLITGSTMDYSVTYGVPGKIKSVVPADQRLPEKRYEEFRNRISEEGIKTIINGMLQEWQ